MRGDEWTDGVFQVNSRHVGDVDGNGPCSGVTGVVVADGTGAKYLVPVPCTGTLVQYQVHGTRHLILWYTSLSNRYGTGRRFARNIYS
jgi:hypothetical protein